MHVCGSSLVDMNHVCFHVYDLLQNLIVQIRNNVLLAVMTNSVWLEEMTFRFLWKIGRNVSKQDNRA